MIILGTYQAPVGELIIAVKNEKLIGLWKKNQKYAMSTVKEEALMEENDSLILRVKDWLSSYFSGQHPDPLLLPIEWLGTEFQKSVWQHLLTIPYGKTETYQGLAKKIAAIHHKEHMSAQAIGGAVSHNPISIVVPCHRVIATSGDLTGYAGGLAMKKYLLEWEKKTGF